MDQVKNFSRPRFQIHNATGRMGWIFFLRAGFLALLFPLLVKLSYVCVEGGME